MHNEILSQKQVELLKLISSFSKQFYLVGGTAIALQIGHRQSIDFDLFSKESIKPNSIKNLLVKKGYFYNIIYEEFEQLHVLIDSVKLTFFTYPFEIDARINFNHIINMPSLLSLAAMKAFAIGGRAKWKDYVDMYFLLRDHFNIKEIERMAEKIFENRFNAKLFRQQLVYFQDIDYSEKVIYNSEAPDDEIIKRFLIEISTSKL